jgi:hypothetical protein
MAMGQPRIGQFPGPWPIQGTIGSPSTTYSPVSSPMFHDTYVPGMSRFTLSLWSTTLRCMRASRLPCAKGRSPSPTGCRRRMMA